MNNIFRLIHANICQHATGLWSNLFVFMVVPLKNHNRPQYTYSNAFENGFASTNWLSSWTKSQNIEVWAMSIGVGQSQFTKCWFFLNFLNPWWTEGVPHSNTSACPVGSQVAIQKHEGNCGICWSALVFTQWGSINQLWSMYELSVSTGQMTDLVGL